VDHPVITAKHPVLGAVLPVSSAKMRAQGGHPVVFAAKHPRTGANLPYNGGMPRRLSTPELVDTVQKAQLALLFNQKQLGELMGSSQRTVQRWYAGQSHPYPWEIAKLVVAVHPHSPEIALRLAEGIGQSLETLGVLPAPSPPPPEPPPSPAPSAMAPLLAESVVAAAAEALDVSPRVARPGVLAAVERAKAAALSIDDLLALLRPPAPGKRGKREG
jgi:hypothetical protein